MGREVKKVENHCSRKRLQCKFALKLALDTCLKPIVGSVHLFAFVYIGGIAIPGACIGIFLGGYLLKRFSLWPKGAIQMVMGFNLLGLSFYGLLFVLGCDYVKMAGT